MTDSSCEVWLHNEPDAITSTTKCVAFSHRYRKKKQSTDYNQPKQPTRENEIRAGIFETKPPSVYPQCYKRRDASKSKTFSWIHSQMSIS